MWIKAQPCLLIGSSVCFMCLCSPRKLQNNPAALRVSIKFGANFKFVASPHSSSQFPCAMAVRVLACLVLCGSVTGRSGYPVHSRTHIRLLLSLPLIFLSPSLPSPLLAKTETMMQDGKKRRAGPLLGSCNHPQPHPKVPKMSNKRTTSQIFFSGFKFTHSQMYIWTQKCAS